MSDTKTVYVRRLGQERKRVSIPLDGTIANALAEAKITVGAGERIWANGDEATLGAKINDGETIMLQPDVKHGAY